jgi:folylpolyglutamate synthase
VRERAIVKCTLNPTPFRQMLLTLIKRPFPSTCIGLLRNPISDFPHYHITTPRSIMDESGRTYTDALALLDTLQSNRMIVKSIWQSDGAMNLDAIPEMLNWVDKAGYTVDDFNKLRVIHVGGTKGKGSVCALVASILQQYSNLTNMTKATANKTIKTDSANQNLATEAEGPGKVGLYTSPHLITVRERIRINNEPISQSLFASYFFTLWDRFSASAAAAGYPNPIGLETKPGYFRYLTIMALHVFLQEGVRTAIVECGIGGEYDSTNILTKEAVTVTAITRLGIDHVGMLGDSLDKIAWHKGGIMKEAVQCFTMPQELEAMHVLEERAKEKHAELTVVKRMEHIESGDVKIGLEGDFQKDNASLAVAVAGAHLSKMGFSDVLHGEKLPEEFLRGLEQVKWEGRCEVRTEGNIEWCIDGAHTIESIIITAEWFAGKLQRSTKAQAMLIFNQQERDGASLVLALHMGLERATGTRHIFSNAAFCTNAPYKIDPSEDHTADDLRVQRTIADAWSEFGPDTEIEVNSSIEEAVEIARDISKDSEKLLVLVTGSLHLVGGFLNVLQGEGAAS